MTKRKYAGTWTALITPFKKNGSVDEEALRGLVRRQAEAGVTGVVPIGTTGESPTTTAEEDERIFTIVVEEARKIAKGGGMVAGGLSKDGGDGMSRRLLVMAGTGSNCTREAIKHTQSAKRAGVDACLVVTPYYNKPTPKGLKLHFKAVADLGLPVIVYNIKGRTGINIDTDTLMEIAAHPMIAGVKEASGDLAQMKEVLRRREELEGGGAGGGGREFAVLCGDDGLTLELMKMRPDEKDARGVNSSEGGGYNWGGDGVVSVASNLVPGEVAKMVGLAAEGKFEEAGVLNEKLMRLFKEIFVETNPIPVKYIASRMGLCELSYRLPMCEPSEKAVAVLEELMKVYGLV